MMWFKQLQVFPITGTIPRDADAFTKLSRIYGYFDFKNKWLILNTSSDKNAKFFITFLQKTINNISVTNPEFKNLTTVMTNWLQHNNAPSSLTIEDACVLQSPMTVGKVIRCKRQDLSTKGIHFFLQEGYKVYQMLLTWRDRITFSLTEDFKLFAIKYMEVVRDPTENEGETEEGKKFSANFIIMTDILSHFLSDLFNIFAKR